MERVERDFKGIWIPKELWLNEGLTLLEKCIFVEIDSLDNENHCTASNEYFANFCNCSVSKITKAVSKLEELGMIEVLAFDGRHRKIRVTENTRQSSKKYEADSQKVRTNNIVNSKKISISKDIDIESEKKFTFGQRKEKSKSKSLFDKCLDLIDAFTNDSILQSLLIEALKQFISNSKETDRPFYSNNFKGKLNQLKALTEDNYEQRKIVTQTLNKGWNDFYALKSDTRQSRPVSTDMGRQTQRLTKEQKERARKAIEDGTAEKF